MALCGWASIVGFDGVVDWWGIVGCLIRVLGILFVTERELGDDILGRFYCGRVRWRWWQEVVFLASTIAILMWQVSFIL